MYMHSMCEMKMLALIFGVTVQNVSRCINKNLPLLVKILCNHPDAKVEWPTPEEGAMLASRCARKYPDLQQYNCWGAIDGSKIQVQRSNDASVQEAYYNGYIHTCCVVNVLAIDTRGVFRFAVVNCTGTTHDAMVAMSGGQLRSCRQISEWGMRIFQLPRLHVTLPLGNNTLRQAILMCSVLINNFKVNNGQHNQITTTFD